MNTRVYGHTCTCKPGPEPKPTKRSSNSLILPVERPRTEDIGKTHKSQSNRATQKQKPGALAAKKSFATHLYSTCTTRCVTLASKKTTPLFPRTLVILFQSERPRSVANVHGAGSRRVLNSEIVWLVCSKVHETGGDEKEAPHLHEKLKQASEA